ncbi:hypothetical protein Tco_0969359 [Tanacetum coccineum]
MASLVGTKKQGTTLKEQDTSSKSGKCCTCDDADSRPIYDEEPMAEVQTTAKINVFAIGQQHTEQPEFNNEGKPALQPRRNQSVVRQPTAFKSERPRISKQRFASQVDVNNDLSKLVTTHYLPKERESVVAKPHHMIAPGSSRWKPTGKIFKTVGLRWVPTGKIFTSSTTKVDSEPTNGSNDDITNQYECAQTLDVSADETVTTSNELDLLCSMMFDELLNGSPTVVSKTSAVTTADAFDKRQQQPDSTSSTSTLATIVTADGNFDVYIFLFFSLF